MKYEIHLSRVAEKDLARLGSDGERAKVVAALRNLEANPHAGQALTGDLAGFFSFHLSLSSGQARAIYVIIHERLVVLIIALGMRESIYKTAVRRAKAIK